jgi:PAS domain S-box-containing protein
MRDNLKASDAKLIDAAAEIRAIYNASPDAVIVVDQEGTIVKWDNKAEQLFGWSEQEVMGRTLTDTIIPARLREPHEKGMKQFLKNGDNPTLGRTMEVAALRKNNTEFDISLSISVSMIKGEYRFIGFIRDITPRKKAEVELQRKNKELEQFAYVASHDLQEPLRTTSSFVELFQQQYKGKLDENADKYLAYIVQASDRMKVLIKDLLDYSRIGHKKELENVDCNSVLGEVIEDIGIAIKDGDAEIKTNKLPVIKGYPTEIKQLFQNLITNAIKFRRKDVTPRVEISAKKSDAHYTFTVKDNGIGIEKEHRERIFIIFQRLHTRTEYQGSGIGLAHCKKIVELHGGKIWIESNPGEGSSFHFTILQNTN